MGIPASIFFPVRKGVLGRCVAQQSYYPKRTNRNTMQMATDSSIRGNPTLK